MSDAEPCDCLTDSLEFSLASRLLLRLLYEVQLP